MTKTPSILIGVAGEYFVAAELSRRGYIASITLRNSKGVDILASNREATRQVGIQVKTNHHSKRDWILNEKAEDYYADNLFYVFVNLIDEEKKPDYFIVPSQLVADYVRKDHSEWLATPDRRGRAHRDSPVRKFRDPDRHFLDRWDLLGL